MKGKSYVKAATGRREETCQYRKGQNRREKIVSGDEKGKKDIGGMFSVSADKMTKAVNASEKKRTLE